MYVCDFITALPTAVLCCTQGYAETAEGFSENHVERLFLFAVIWGFGGALSVEEQVDLSNLLKSLTNGLPDDDSAVSVFDYYVDESGEWDVWQTWYETQYLQCCSNACCARLVWKAC